MSSPPVSIFSPPPGFWWTVALAFCVVVLAPVLAWFGGRGRAAAELQTSLNDAFRALTAELQSERSALIARIVELEGRDRQAQQHTASLEGLLRRRGIAIPRRPIALSDGRPESERER